MVIDQVGFSFVKACHIDTRQAVGDFLAFSSRFIIICSLDFSGLIGRLVTLGAIVFLGNFLLLHLIIGHNSLLHLIIGHNRLLHNRLLLGGGNTRVLTGQLMLHDQDDKSLLELL